MILEGEATDLSWDSIDAVSVAIDQGIGAVPISGTMTVTPSQTTTYTITATLADNSKVSATTTIVVARPMTLRIQAPVDGSTTYSPFTTVSGTVDGSVAVVTVNNFMANLSGGVFTAEVPLVAGDNPLTVVAVGQTGNSISSVVSIRYEDITPPEITIVSPVDGDTTTASRLTVSGTIDDHTASVTVNGYPGKVTGDTFVAENVPLPLSGLNTLHVVATDPYDNSSTASVTVNCAAQPLVRFRTGNQIIRDGQSTVLSWETFYADNVTIDNGLGAVSLSGSYEVSPSATTTYTLTAGGFTGTTTSKVTVTVTGPPPTASFDQQLIKISQGGTATLSWTSTNSQYAHIDNGVGSVLTNGTLGVTPEATTSYTLTVTGPSGSASTKVLVKVLGSPEPQPERSFGEQYLERCQA